MSLFYGIDVGVGSVKVVVLNKGATGLELAAIGEAKNLVGEWKKGDTKAMEGLARTVKTLLKDLKIGADQAVVSLAEDEVISRLVRLPPLKENEIRDALKFEAETFVPYPLSEVSLDYMVVEEDDTGKMSVFTIAARNDLIQAYIKLFKLCNVELLALESPAIAVRRVVGMNSSGLTNVMIVDLGEKYSDLIHIGNGNVRFTRAMSVGGESLTRAISVNLGLDMASAEEYKKAYGMKEMELEGKIKQAILPVFNNMAEEIRRGMALANEEMGKPVELLILSGGGANMPGMAEELTKLLGVEVQVIQPFLKIDTTKIVLPIDLTTDGCRFTLALGLALRGLE